MSNRRWCILWLLLAAVCPLRAQLDPEGAQVISYFPQLADGGPSYQQWATSLTLENPNQSSAANAIISIFGDDGKPLALDFGNGPVSTFNATLPAQGSVTYKSKGTASTTVTGWAVVVSSLPLQGVIQFSYTANGIPQQGVSAQATPASILFHSPATTTTGIAIANIYNTSAPATIIAFDSNGHNVGQSSVTLPPNGHQSFTLAQIFPSLNSSFRGSITIGGNGNELVAWTLSGDGGVLSSYPPSGLAWPVSQFERIWKVWEKILNSGLTLVPLSPPPTLVIDYSTGQINSYALGPKNEVHIFMNLAELISDSESELGFVVGHELGHIIQYQTQQLVFVPSNAEEDADEYGMFLSMLAGYDPYGGAGALAKLSMASGDAGLVAQVFDGLSTDPHGSFNNRLALMFNYMQTMCSQPSMTATCAQYKSLVHPHLPSFAPLAVTVGQHP